VDAKEQDRQIPAESGGETEESAAHQDYEASLGETTADEDAGEDEKRN